MTPEQAAAWRLSQRDGVQPRRYKPFTEMVTNAAEMRSGPLTPLERTFQDRRGQTWRVWSEGSFRRDAPHG